MQENRTLEQLERISVTLDGVRGDVVSLTTSQAVQTEQLRQIVEHLARLNGRVAKTEERLSALDNIVAEARGAWKFIALLSAIPSGLIGAAAVWISQYSGGK